MIFRWLIHIYLSDYNTDFDSDFNHDSATGFEGNTIQDEGQEDANMTDVEPHSPKSPFQPLSSHNQSPTPAGGPEPTPKPSREQLFVFSSFNLLTILLAKFDVFLKGLTDESIDRAMACFQEGLNSRKVHPGDFDPRRAQITCHSILRMTNNGSTAISTVCDIPRFWTNINGLVKSSNLTTVETTMTRVFCMQGTLKFHYWLEEVIPAAIQRISKSVHEPKIWIDKLAAKVQSSILIGGDATFNSFEYLPKLPNIREYMVTLPKKVLYDTTNLLTSIMASTLRCWLDFPAGEDSIAQINLLNIVLSNSLASIMFLDKIWDMYDNPFAIVFNNNWGLRRSKKQLKAAFDDFANEFSLHPFADSDSSSYQKLKELSLLIDRWTKYAGVDSNTSETVS